MVDQKALGRLLAAKKMLTRQQYKTIRGQILAGDATGAMANEKRLIDANALVRRIQNSTASKAVRGVCAVFINSAPTVDAVEVVRCKDCGKHTDTKEPNVVYCKKFNRFMRAFDFCSYGERREEE